MGLYELLGHPPCPQQREAAKIMQEVRLAAQEEGGREKEDLIFVSGHVLRTTDLVKHLLEEPLESANTAARSALAGSGH